MRATLLRIVRLAGFVAASCLGGWLLGALISHSTLWMPAWLWDTMRAIVRLSGIDALYNEEDVETLCLMALMVFCSLAVALVLHFGCRASRFYRPKQQKISR